MVSAWSTDPDTAPGHGNPTPRPKAPPPEHEPPTETPRIAPAGSDRSGVAVGAAGEDHLIQIGAGTWRMGAGESGRAAGAAEP